MKIDGTNTLMNGMNVMQKNDTVSKNIQKQIANAQKQLQELSSNKEISLEEKMKRRQEIQQQINDLNNQLRQHQIEQRKEKASGKGSSMDDMLSSNNKEASKSRKQGDGLSQASMKAMISADAAMSTARVQSSVRTKMEGKAGILESEIKLDGARGVDVEEKQEELAGIKEKIATTENAQMNTLAKANKELEEASNVENKTEEVDDKDKKDDKNTINLEKTTSNESEIVIDNIDTSAKETVIYSHVDVSI